MKRVKIQREDINKRSLSIFNKTSHCTLIKYAFVPHSKIQRSQYSGRLAIDLGGLLASYFLDDRSSVEPSATKKIYCRQVRREFYKHVSAYLTSLGAQFFESSFSRKTNAEIVQAIGADARVEGKAFASTPSEFEWGFNVKCKT